MEVLYSLGSTSSFGLSDFNIYLIKTDENGDEQWNKTFCGSNLDEGY